MKLFNELQSLIVNSTQREVLPSLWAKIPTYTVGDNFVRLIPFKDHINIEAIKVKGYEIELSKYKITPKGMLQIYIQKKIPVDVLKKIFMEILSI